MRIETGGKIREARREIEEGLTWHARVDLGDVLVRAADVTGPDALHRARRFQEVALALFLERLSKRGLTLRLQEIALLLRDLPRRDQLVHVHLAHRRLAIDELVHERLREAWLVAFVVTVLPVAEHVDDDVFAEALAELDREARSVDHRL